MSLELVKPDIVHNQSYKEALKELKSESSNPESLAEDAANTETVITHLNEVAEGKGLLPGEVPRSEFWLVEGDRYLGRIQIRHQASGKIPTMASHIYYEVRPSARGRGFGTELLRRGLVEAKKLGLNEVIVTCNKDNIESQKIIMANGGHFVKEALVQPDLVLIKYRIKLP